MAAPKLEIETLLHSDPSEAPGRMADGSISVGTPDEMRSKLQSWERIQMGMGDVPPVDEENDADFDASDIGDFDNI